MDIIVVESVLVVVTIAELVVIVLGEKSNLIDSKDVCADLETKLTKNEMITHAIQVLQLAY